MWDMMIWYENALWNNHKENTREVHHESSAVFWELSLKIGTSNCDTFFHSVELILFFSVC